MPSRHGMEGSPRWRAPLGDKELRAEPHREGRTRRWSFPHLGRPGAAVLVVVEVVDAFDPVQGHDFRPYVEPAVLEIRVLHPVRLLRAGEDLDEVSGLRGQVGAGEASGGGASGLRARGDDRGRFHLVPIRERARSPIDRRLERRNELAVSDEERARPAVVEPLGVFDFALDRRDVGIVVQADASWQKVSRNANAQSFRGTGPDHPAVRRVVAVTHLVDGDKWLGCFGHLHGRNGLPHLSGGVIGIGAWRWACGAPRKGATLDRERLPTIVVGGGGRRGARGRSSGWRDVLRELYTVVGVVEQFLELIDRLLDVVAPGFRDAVELRDDIRLCLVSARVELLAQLCQGSGEIGILGLSGLLDRVIEDGADLGKVCISQGAARSRLGCRRGARCRSCRRGTRRGGRRCTSLVDVVDDPDGVVATVARTRRERVSDLRDGGVAARTGVLDRGINRGQIIAREL